MRKIILLLMCFSLIGTASACSGSATNDEAITEIREQLTDARATIDEQSEQLKELTSDYAGLKEQLDSLERTDNVSAKVDKPIPGDDTTAVSASGIETQADEALSEEMPDASQEGTEAGIVYVTASGSKYHSISDCSNMKTPLELALSEAEAQGYTPCTKCY